MATVEPANKTDNVELIFFDGSAAEFGAVLGRVGVGALPDMVPTTPDGAHALVANEGEPAEDYSYDPDGSVAVVKPSTDVAAAPQDDLQNVEPEYIAVSGGKAYITLQENNAIATVEEAFLSPQNSGP